MPKRSFVAPAVALVLFLGFAARAAGDDASSPAGAGKKLTLSGYLKEFPVVFRLAEPLNPDGAPPQPLLGQSITTLRLNLKYAPTDKISVLAAYSASPRIQDPLFFQGSAFSVALATGNYRLTDFRTPLIPAPGRPVGSFGLYGNLDRLSVSFKLRFGDLILGRQPVAWGSGKITNPTDIIAPFNFYDLDKEERFGVDAVRLRVPLGRLSELDTGWVFGKDARFDRSAFFLRTKVHVLKTDLSLLAVGFQRDLLVGLDLARSVGGSGVWLEAAYVQPGALSAGSALARPPAYGRLTAGVDRSLGGKVYAYLEYHFNAAGASGPARYAALFATPAYTRGTVYLLGRHYVSAGATYQASGLLTLSGLVIGNATDGSLAVSPQADYNIAQNIYLGGGVYLGLGRRPLTPLFGGALPPSLRSEFGSYPDFAHLSFRVYF